MKQRTPKLFPFLIPILLYCSVNSGCSGLTSSTGGNTGGAISLDGSSPKTTPPTGGGPLGGTGGGGEGGGGGGGIAQAAPSWQESELVPRVRWDGIWVSAQGEFCYHAYPESPCLPAPFARVKSWWKNGENGAWVVQKEFLAGPDGFFSDSFLLQSFQDLGEVIADTDFSMGSRTDEPEVTTGGISLRLPAKQVMAIAGSISPHSTQETSFAKFSASFCKGSKCSDGETPVLQLNAEFRHMEGSAPFPLQPTQLTMPGGINEAIQ